MWYPNRAQWWVIWITTLVVLALWIGVAEYSGDQENRFVVSLAVVGMLLVWMRTLCGARTRLMTTLNSSRDRRHVATPKISTAPF